MKSGAPNPVLIGICLTLLAALAPSAGTAGERWFPDAVHGQGFAPRTMADRRISLEQAIAIVQRQTGGRVLDARPQGDRFRIKVLTRSGEVIVVYVDAQTGATR